MNTSHDNDFSLTAAILWEYCCGYWLLPEQLQGIRSSADFFCFRLDEGSLLEKLDAVVDGLPPAPHVVHVEISRDGEITLRTEESAENREPVTAGLANQPIDRDNPFIYHRTSRPVHTGIEAALRDVDEIIYWNDRGEITETATASIVVELDGVQVTPPVSCGLYPDAYRAKLLADGRFMERPVHKDELKDSTKVYLINSLVGWREVASLLDQSGS